MFLDLEILEIIEFCGIPNLLQLYIIFERGTNNMGSGHYFIPNHGITVLVLPELLLSYDILFLKIF